MAYSDGIISAPVSVRDVQRALGVGSGDVGTLCKSENIKRWAKFKPVNIGGTYGGSSYVNTTPLLNSQNRWNESLSFQWWRDTIRNNNMSRYGILPIVATNMKALYDAYHDGDDWQYYTPTGGVNYPFRLIDFNQYNHNADEPLGIEVGNWTQNLTGSWSFTLDLPSSPGDSIDVSQRDYIVPRDILKTLWGVTTVYYGLAIFDASNNSLVYAATSSTISGTGPNVGTSTLSYDKDYYIIPFFSNSFIAGSSSLGGATVALVPNSSMGVMHTSQSGTQKYGRYILKASFGPTGKLSVRTTISTETYGGVQYPAHTFQNVTMYVCLPTTYAPETGSPSSYIYKEEYGNIYIAANSRWDSDLWQAYPTQDSVICYLYEDGKKRATANALKPDPVEPPTPTSDVQL